MPPAAADPEALVRAKEELRILRQASFEIGSTLDVEAIGMTLLRTMDELFGFRHSLLLLLERDANTLTVAASRGYARPAERAQVAVGVGVIGMAARRRRIVRVGNLSRHRAYATAVRREVERSPRSGELEEIPKLPGLPDVETQIAIPLLSRDTLVGVFAVESSMRTMFSEREEHLAGIVGSLAAAALHNALLYRQTLRANEGLRHERAGARSQGFDSVVGESRAMKAVRKMLQKVAVTPSSTVLLTGENGTGKDLAAKVIHSGSARAGAPFLNITCSALPESLLESELFGHERGAFTDARQQKKGLLELADRGTVFLDEIGEMRLPLQAKLLRFLEDKSFRRVGGTHDLRVDVRIIAATNRDLRKAVREGAFREDLYYRLRVLPVELPPLRERPEDIPVLAKLFFERFRAEFRKSVSGLAPEALARLKAYPWPGNVRELRNAMERAVLLAEGPVLLAEDFAFPSADESCPFRIPAGGLRFAALERDLIVQALERTGGNQTRAAALLDVDRDWLRYRIDRHDLRRHSRPRGRPAGKGG